MLFPSSIALAERQKLSKSTWKAIDCVEILSRVAPIWSISIHSEAPSTQKPAVIITASQTLELPALCTPRSPKPDHVVHHTRSEDKGVRFQASARTCSLKERRGGDSNPRRRDYRRNGFRDRRIQPLCHLSVAECIHLAPPLQPHRPYVPEPCISISGLFQWPGSFRLPPTNLDQQSMHLEPRALQILVFWRRDRTRWIC